MIALPTLALTIRQPWASFILHYGKLIENRHRNYHHRGPFFVHAAKTMTLDGYEDALYLASQILGLSIEALEKKVPRRELPRGGIIGQATLDGIIRPGDMDHATLRPDVDVRWHDPSQFGLVLRDPKPLPFVACRGAENRLFEVPADVREKLGEAIKDTRNGMETVA